MDIVADLICICPCRQRGRPLSRARSLPDTRSFAYAWPLANSGSFPDSRPLSMTGTIPDTRPIADSGAVTPSGALHASRPLFEEVAGTLGTQRSHCSGCPQLAQFGKLARAALLRKVEELIQLRLSRPRA